VTDEVTDWKTYGLRDLPGMSARSLVVDSPPPVQEIVDERLACLAEPLRGVTTDGVLRPGLYRLDQKAASTAAIGEAALRFLDALTPEQRTRATLSCWRICLSRHGSWRSPSPLPPCRLAG
jgi:hypothetical protein